MGLQHRTLATHRSAAMWVMPFVGPRAACGYYGNDGSEITASRDRQSNAILVHEYKSGHQKRETSRRIPDLYMVNITQLFYNLTFPGSAVACVGCIYTNIHKKKSSMGIYYIVFDFTAQGSIIVRKIGFSVVTNNNKNYLYICKCQTVCPDLEM